MSKKRVLPNRQQGRKKGYDTSCILKTLTRSDFLTYWRQHMLIVYIACILITRLPARKARSYNQLLMGISPSFT